MNKQINLALQVLPRAEDKDTYALVDEAIKIIEESGVKYRVCPFETVMEGDFDQLMDVVKKVHEACYAAGAENMLAYVKIQSNAETPVTIEDKMAKYDGA
ncbi:MTH1187 family thiamine-binding protein [Prolixibacter denitrificans]|uniref:Uncharacterized protein (TIGR00106 family) n=2 Tax=Prolixibacter TaxID=314318 RepID=A0A2P8CFV8_9BACT|nr:MTH1187 family thiamine-binding protein [Prolixibacter denitrificans]PSK83870.1 uncharacterized protein (TIGR00106 family) [Prolixibacter denitrificans]GET23411.1 hypothetical protein JCM18694_36570 [Prolixibacter denitrificans]